METFVSEMDTSVSETETFVSEMDTSVFETETLNGAKLFENDAKEAESNAKDVGCSAKGMMGCTSMPEAGRILNFNLQEAGRAVNENRIRRLRDGVSQGGMKCQEALWLV